MSSFNHFEKNKRIRFNIILRQNCSMTCRTKTDLSKFYVINLRFRIKLYETLFIAIRFVFSSTTSLEAFVRKSIIYKLIEMILYHKL